MKFEKVLLLAVDNKLPVEVTYELGKKDLGVYVIEVVYPATLLLTPTDGYRNKIWVPNPLAVSPEFVVTSWNPLQYKIEIYEGTKVPMDLIWQLTFNYEDLSCLK